MPSWPVVESIITADPVTVAPFNTGDKGSRLRPHPADANGVGLASAPLNKVADIDIVTARGESVTSCNAQCGVAAAGCVALERIKTLRLKPSAKAQTRRGRV